MSPGPMHACAESILLGAGPYSLSRNCPDLRSEVEKPALQTCTAQSQRVHAVQSWGLEFRSPHSPDKTDILYMAVTQRGKSRRITGVWWLLAWEIQAFSSGKDPASKNRQGIWEEDVKHLFYGVCMVHAHPHIYTHMSTTQQTNIGVIEEER